MQSAPRITFRDIPASPALEERILERLEKLEQFYDRIISCHVVLETPHAHHHKGKLYQVRIDMVVPGHEIVVNRGPAANHSHEDPYVAIRDAFNAIERQLEDYSRRQKGLVKSHEEPPRGHIVRLFPDEGYGFILTPEGTEVYFHKNAVLNGAFEHLSVGSEVHFVEEPGDKGPQASTVKLSSRIA